jgi:Fanconi anemia group D2 protein
MKLQSTSTGGVLQELGVTPQPLFVQPKTLKLFPIKNLSESPFFATLVSCNLKSARVGEEEKVFVCEDELHFRKSLESTLSKEIDGGEQFVSSFQTELEKINILMQCASNVYTAELTEAENVEDNELCSFSETGVSLIRLLLKIELIQERVIDAILEMLTIHASTLDSGESENERSMSLQNGCERNVTKLLLSQLQWIDIVYNGQALTNKLLECLQVCPLDSQRDIIQAIPEIIDDAEQETVVETLLETMESEMRLTVSILDAISNLFLAPRKKEEATERVLNTLGSASLTDLPVIVRFLIDGCTPGNTENIICILRKHLSELIGQISIITDDGDETERTSSEALLLEALRASLLHRKDVVVAWTKIIESCSVGHRETSDGNLRSLCSFDVWVLGSLYGMKKEKDTVEKIIFKKSSVGMFSFEFISSVFHGHSVALAPLFNNYLNIAANLFYGRGHSRTAENARVSGRSLYMSLFMEYKLDYYRQEIVGNLITHIGSGVQHEINAALGTFEGLLKAEDASLNRGLRTFLAFIRGLLDYVEYLTIEQQRSVFFLLTSLSLPDQRTRQSSAVDEITIIVRKMLSSTISDVRRVGIVGGTAILCVVSLAERKHNDAFFGGGRSTSSQIDSRKKSSPFNQLSNDMLRMLQESCNSQSNGDFNAIGFFYEELASALSNRRYGDGTFSEVFLSHVLAIVSTKLETGYMMDLPSQAGQIQLEDQQEPLSTVGNGSDVVRHFLGGALTESFRFNLDGSSAAVAVKILPILTSRECVKLNIAPHDIWAVCPLFRLLSVLEIEKVGDLSAVDACLGCPLALFNETNLDDLDRKSQQVQNTVCDALFIGANWIREMLNSFIHEASAVMRAKVFLRATHLLEIETNLRQAIAANPTYRPPPYASTNLVTPTNTSKLKRKRVQKALVPKKKVKPVAKSKSVAKAREGSLPRVAAEGDENEDTEDEDESNSEEDEPMSLPFPKKHSGTAPESQANKTQVAAETYELVQSMLRPLVPEVAHILSFSQMQRKLVETGGETVDIHTLALSPTLLNFVLAHVMNWLKTSLPKGSNSSPLSLARAANSQNVSGKPRRSCEEIMVMLTEKISCFSSLSNHEIPQFPVMQTISVALQDIKEYIKNNSVSEEMVLVRIENDDDKSLILPAIHKILLSIKTICECERLRQSKQGILLMTKAFRMFDESEEEEEDDAALPIWNDLSDACRSMYDSLEDLYNIGLPSIEDDVIPLLQTLEAVAMLQKYAKKQSLAANEPVLEIIDGDDVMSQRDAMVSYRLSVLCRRLLEKNWEAESNRFSRAGGKPFKYKMGTLGWTLRLHLTHAEMPLDAAEYVIQDVLTQFLQLDGGEDFVEAFPTLTKGSLSIFFVVLLESLVSIMKKIDFKNGKSKVVLFESRKVALHLKTIVLFTKSDSFVTVSMMTNVLKQVRIYVDILNKNMAFFENFFVSRQDEIVGLFKLVQSSTRQVHNICAYGKNEKKNAQVATLIPGVKRSMEEFIFRVKGMLVSSGPSTGVTFWAGNLRTRNLDGSEWQAANDDYSSGDE